MNRRKFIAATTGAALISQRGWGHIAGASDMRPASVGSAEDVGARAQLFVDRHLVQRTERIRYTVHPGRKHPFNPLVRNDRAWEGWWVRVLGGTVLYDEQERLFKMWYFTVSDCFPDFAVLYATSRDGIAWDKPLVGLVKCPGHPRHNAIRRHMEVVSVFKDVLDQDPSRRYKMIACDNRKIAPSIHPNNPHCYVSPDGLNWTQLSDTYLFYSSDVLTAYFDRERGLYVAFPKVRTVVRGLSRRCFGVTTSPDMLNWTETKMAFVPDEQDDAGSLARIDPARAILGPDDPALMRTEFYGITTYQAESCVVGFPWVFTINNHLESGKHDGVCEIQLAVSRDPDSWARPFRDAIVPPGPPGSWDCGFVTASAHAFRYGDEVRLYYSSQNYSHGDPAAKVDPGPESKAFRGIGLVTWPLDRFVSADGDSTGGTLTTVPLRASGRRLELNMNAGKSNARALVRLLDSEGRPIAGYESSEPLTTDSLRQTVTWRGNPDLGALAGQAVCLQFELQNAELYSFAFRT